MTAASLLISELRGSLVGESARMARDFAATGDGRAAVAERTRLIEEILKRLWRGAAFARAVVAGAVWAAAAVGFGCGREVRSFHFPWRLFFWDSQSVVRL